MNMVFLGKFCISVPVRFGGLETHTIVIVYLILIEIIIG